MLDLNSNKTWYGMLVTSKSSSPVIFDPKLPAAPTGQVYLYNMERKAIVQYLWSAVKERLQDLPAQEKQQIKQLSEKDWKAARKEFLRNNQSKLAPATRTRSAPAAPLQSNDNASDEWDDVELEDMAFD